jgi:hypothetical protein
MKRLAVILSLGILLALAGGCKSTRYTINVNYEFAPNSSVSATILDK